MLINKCTEETGSEETMGQRGQDVGISVVCLWLTFQKATDPHSPITISEVLSQHNEPAVYPCN